MHRNSYKCKISTFVNAVFLLVLWTFEKFRYLKDLVGLIFLAEPKILVTKHLWKNAIALKNQHGYLAGFLLKTQIMYPPIKHQIPNLTLYGHLVILKNLEQCGSLGKKKIKLKKPNLDGSLSFKRKTPYPINISKIKYTHTSFFIIKGLCVI